MNDRESMPADLAELLARYSEEFAEYAGKILEAAIRAGASPKR
jgi:hypothetical protein